MAINLGSFGGIIIDNFAVAAAAAVVTSSPPFRRLNTKRTRELPSRDWYNKRIISADFERTALAGCWRATSCYCFGFYGHGPYFAHLLELLMG